MSMPRINRTVGLIEFDIDKDDPVYVAPSVFRSVECYPMGSAYHFKVHYDGWRDGFVMAYNSVNDYLRDAKRLRMYLLELGVNNARVDTRWVGRFDNTPGGVHRVKRV